MPRSKCSKGLLVRIAAVLTHRMRSRTHAHAFSVGCPHAFDPNMLIQSYVSHDERIRNLTLSPPVT
jgi:hypothetical protein